MIKIAICQLRTETDRDETMRKAKAMIYEAAANGADFAVLPEMFNCPYSREYFKKFAGLGHEETVKQLSAWAKDCGMYIVGGSVPETADGKIYNTCFVFDREGNQIARHRKIHLFDVELPMDAAEQKSDIRCHLAEELARREEREYRLVITFDFAI